MFLLPVFLSRKSLRGYVFVVVFACSLAAFTLTPISITDTVARTPLKAQKPLSPYLLLGYQAHWPKPAAESPSPHDDSSTTEDSNIIIHPESTPTIPHQPLSPRPTHTFRSDGLLQVNPDARHPILDLIARAEDEWNTKLARASRTLPDAGTSIWL
ncbi:hypothetical protein AZE42_04183 [Rhizopogon vesiculosus]|uniref:Uncharacterized protein n=1 Tax=Rhizopogon vesiculosus TaxID=180088 RepID=A0A1J8QSY0_9AGAM|nr:hypothetical protein AZE42_04183 [Rhizopogon vesiculosus]